MDAHILFFIINMFFPDSINQSHTDSYTLIIRLEDGLFSFAIHNPTQRKGYIYRTTELSNDIPHLQQIQKIVFDLPILSQIYKQVYVQVVSARYTIVPDSFTPSDLQERVMLLQSCYHQDVEYPISEVLQEGKCSVIFDINKDIYGFLSRHLDQPLFTHHIVCVTKQLGLHLQTQIVSPSMFIYMHNAKMDIIVSHGGDILMCQTFVADSLINYLYHIINIWQHHKLNQLTDKLILVGEVSACHRMKQECSRFIKNIDIRTSPSDRFLLGEDAEKTPLDIFGLIM